MEVIGYTDNQPIRTVQFPSNFQLSAARAKAAADIIARTIGTPSRITHGGTGGCRPDRQQRDRRGAGGEPADRGGVAEGGLGPRPDGERESVHGLPSRP